MNLEFQPSRFNPTPNHQPHPIKRLHSTNSPRRKTTKPTINYPIEPQKNRRTKTPAQSLRRPEKTTESTTRFTHQKSLKKPIMKKIDAIALTPFWAIGRTRDRARFHSKFIQSRRCFA